MTMLIIDFETRSTVDIRVHGADIYATSPMTSLLCLCAIEMIEQKPCRTWTWRHTDGDLPSDLVATIESASYLVAHNAAFDAAIWDFVAVPEYNFPPVPFEKWFCSASQCRVNALPASLDAASRAIDATQKKDPYGNSLIKKVCCPRLDGTFDDDPVLFQQLVEYCEQDVRATGAILQSTRPMIASEHQDYLVNERINHRGVRVDRELAELACNYADAEKLELDSIICTMTGGVVEKHSQKARVINWIRERLGDDTHEIVKAMEVHKKGELKYTIDSDARERILACADTEATTDILDVVHLVQLGSKSSVSKFRAMLNRADPMTDRVHGAFIYAGAAQTLRFSSQGLQLHNFRRDSFDPTETERLKGLMRCNATLRSPEGDPLSVMDTLSKLLRPAIIPSEGKKFVLCDWSAIEARVMPWLADSPAADEYLDIFRSGRCVYTETAKAIGYDDRQLGKVMVLALGFGGGAGAFAQMARVYGVKMSDKEVAAVIKKWREANDWAVKFWRELEFAAISAIQNPGEAFSAGRVNYLYFEDLLDGTLVCEMPGVSFIQYPRARIENLPVPWGGERPTVTCLKASVKAKREDKQWPRAKLWRGALVENITQAFSGVLLRDSLAILESYDEMVVVAHTHDEIVCEADIAHTDAASVALETVMLGAPAYAESLPLAGEVKVMDRYGK